MNAVDLANGAQMAVGGTSGALHPLVVADFSRVLAGPYATMLMADLGAEVIKVERPATGDDTRAWGPPWRDEEATYFSSVNRNKRSLTIDLHSAEGIAAARQLAQRADVLVENFKPGTFERLGLGYESLRGANPGLIYCSISGFGRSEQARDLPGYDLLVQAVGGLMSITGPRPDEPVKVGVALVDVITGLHAAVGILAALSHRATTGVGQHVEVNLLSSLLSGMVNQSAGFAATGFVPQIMGNRHPSIAPYESFPTADDPLVIAIGNDAQFGACARILGHPEWADDPRFATNPERVRHREELYALMCSALASQGCAAWTSALAAVGIPCGPINDLAAAFKLASRLGLEPVVDIEGEPTVAHPITMSATPASYRRRPPRLGEANDQSLDSLTDKSGAR